MKMNLLVSFSSVLMLFGLYFFENQAASAVESNDAPLSEVANPPATSTDDVLNGNPIKLHISEDAPSSELPNVSGSYGVDEAVKIGAKNNLRLKQSEQSINISKFQARAALGKFGPSASFSTFYSTSSLNQMLFFPNDTTVASSPMQPIVRGTSLSLIFAGTQPLFTSGRILGGYKAARAVERQSKAAYKGASIGTALKVRQSYWEAAWFEAKLKVDSDYVKTKEWSSSNIKARVEEGKAPRADYLREEVALALARAQVNDDYRDFNVALVRLKVVLGVNLSSLFYLKDSLEYAETPGDLSSYLTKAGRNRPEIAQAESKVAEMRARKVVSMSKYGPQVNLYGLGSNITGSSPDGNANGQWGGVVSVIGGITLFDSGTRFNDLRAANEAIRQTLIGKEEVQQKVAEDVSVAWINLDLARKNVELAKTGVISAEEDYRLIHTRYQVGRAIALEDFDAAVKLRQARLSLAEATYRYRLAQAQLLAASGSEY